MCELITRLAVDKRPPSTVSKLAQRAVNYCINDHSLCCTLRSRYEFYNRHPSNCVCLARHGETHIALTFYYSRYSRAVRSRWKAVRTYSVCRIQLVWHFAFKHRERKVYIRIVYVRRNTYSLLENRIPWICIRTKRDISPCYKDEAMKVKVSRFFLFRVINYLN